MMKTNLRALTAAILSLAFVVACTKKRDAELPYGADRDLLTISSYEGKEFDIQTMDLLKPANTGAQVKVSDDREDLKVKVKNFDYVSYKANDPLKLADDTLMLGRPRFNYKMRYVFEGNLLKVMKVGKPEDLSLDEVAAAVDAGDGRVMVPVVSYSVTYFSMDTARNERNEKTSKLEVIQQNGRSGSTHFKIDPNSKTRATFISKTTVLPADFFDGAKGDARDWYFAYTIVGQNFNEEKGALGAMTSVDKYGHEANKVRVKKVEDRLIFYNLAIDADLQKSLETREENQIPVVTLPVDFVDYRFAEAGKTSSVKEESYKERAWDKRSFLELKLKEVKLPTVSDLQISEIKDVQLDEGYFAFTVHSEAAGGLIRFSFYNVKAYQQKLAKQGAQPYKPKVYFPQDEKLFGYFNTKQQILGYYKSSKQELDDTRSFINRFNPTRREVEFRLNQGAPEWTEELVKKAADGWNATFQAAGSSIRVKVTDDHGKVLRGQPGDLRYSLINMYYDVDAAGPWGGYGPVLADPNTGEIIMATANMNLTDRIEGIKFTLNNYILARKGDLDDKYILGIPVPSLKVIVDKAQNSARMIGETFGLKMSRKPVAYDPVKRTFLTNLQLADEGKKPKLTLANHAQFEDRFDLINGNIAAQVAEVCPNLKTYAESLKDNRNNYNLEKEMKLVEDCAVDLAKPVMLSVLLHEMGHNFGLRHNFYGSADVGNFYAPVNMKVGNKTVKTQWVSSSVMDYMPLNFENMTQPGRYDTAAIRWGYLDQVETNSGKLATVSPSAPTTVQMKSDMRKFMYCTDEDTDVIIRDPLCAREDIGTNPVEIVSNLILQYDANIALSNHRNGRAHPRDMETLAFNRYKDYIMPMKRFYEQWRNILAAQAGPGNEYLEAYDDPAKYNQLVASVLDPAKVGENRAKLNKEYKQTADLIFNFLTRVAFMPDYSCLANRTVNGQPTVQMFSFSKIQKNIYGQTGQTVHSCQDPEVKAYLSDRKQAQIIGDGGYAFENLYEDFSVKQVDSNYQPVDKPEVTGMAVDRFFALSALVERTDALFLSQNNQFAPNFLDEVTYRYILNEKILARLTKGVAIQELGITQDNAGQPLREIISPTFETEKPLLSIMLPLFRQGLALPNKTVITNQRLEKYALVPMYYLRGDEDYVCIPIDGYNYCATDQHSESKKLVQQLRQLNNMKAALRISDQSIEKFMDLTKDLLPAKGGSAQLDMTFLDTLMQRIESVSKQNPSLGQELNVLTNVFGLEIQVWQEGTKKKQEKISNEDISEKERMQKLDELKKLKIKELADKLGLDPKQYPGLDQESLKVRVQRFVEKLKMDANAYDADPTELDAQADLILNALMMSR